MTPFVATRAPPRVEQPPASQGPSGLSLHERQEIEVVAGVQASIDEDPASETALLRSLALNPARFEARRAGVTELRRQSSEAENIYLAKYEKTRRDPPR